MSAKLLLSDACVDSWARFGVVRNLREVSCVSVYPVMKLHTATTTLRNYSILASWVGSEPSCLNTSIKLWYWGGFQFRISEAGTGYNQLESKLRGL